MATKILIEDDCIVPDRYLSLTYSGKNPWGVVEQIAKTIKPFFHVSSSGTSNWRLNWDNSGDPISFYSLWWVKVKYSRFSTMWVQIKVQGEKKKATNIGTFHLQLQAHVETKFSGWGPLTKTAWYLYSYLFYNKLRRKYLERCRNTVLQFKNEIKKNFELSTISTPTGGGYG